MKHHQLILQNSTPHSLVIIDKLKRTTSSLDPNVDTIPKICLDDGTPSTFTMLNAERNSNPKALSFWTRKGFYFQLLLAIFTLISDVLEFLYVDSWTWLRYKAPYLTPLMWILGEYQMFLLEPRPNIIKKKYYMDMFSDRSTNISTMAGKALLQNSFRATLAFHQTVVRGFTFYTCITWGAS